MSLQMRIIYWWAGLTMEQIFLITWAVVLGVPVLVAAIVIAAVVRKQKKGGGRDV